MWICLNDGFLSIVNHRDKPGTLLVRARRKGDIERLLPAATVYEDLSADYRYRSDVPASEFGKALAEQAEKIGYENFKGSVADPSLRAAYHDVHARLMRLQK